MPDKARKRRAKVRHAGQAGQKASAARQEWSAADIDLFDLPNLKVSNFQRDD
jgi:hypothetical protein